MPHVRRPRVLFLIDYAHTSGGAERFAVGLACELPRHGFDVWLCSTRHADDEVMHRLADAGVRHVGLHRSAKWDVHRLAGLYPLLRRERFDVLHTHKFGSNAWGTVIGRAARVPVIVAQEHSWAYQGSPGRALIDGHVIARLAARFVAVSSADGERMVRIEHVPREKVVVLPTAYVPSAQGDRAAEGGIRKELGLEPGAPLVGVAAVLRPEKRLDLLLEAHTKVVARSPEAQLVIAGHGVCRRQLEDQADRLGLLQNVHFLGRRADVDQILAEVDVAALSSDREGCPLLAFECMAAGIPLVATAVGGVPDLVEDGRTGLLVERRDPQAMADALVRLLLDRDLRRRMGAAARARLPQFTIDAVAARFAGLYRNLLC